MKRQQMKFLKDWLESDERKPLVIRGARQVGKTWLVRNLAETAERGLIELNFEKDTGLISLFSSNDPAKILLNLSGAFNVEIDPRKSLLFLDEIQAAPELLAKLRWFAEDMPELPVIAAGSLLEFVLENHSFSMPVGRINYMHVEPLSFEEFMLAIGKDKIVDYLINYQVGSEIPTTIHEQLMSYFREFVIIGGMPASIYSWKNNRSFQRVHQVHHDLLATYRDDFSKYCNRIPMQRLDEVMMAVPERLGEKFIYSKVNPSLTGSVIKAALELVCKGRVCHKVRGCAANGVPLSSELQDKFRKVIFLDVGLCSSALGLALDQLEKLKELVLVNSGGIAEQVVGQLLRTLDPPYIEPSLYYWHREEKGSSAEIDYVIQQGNRVIPIEVKAGMTGGLKSLHLFMEAKGYPLAVRINSDYPSFTNIEVKSSVGGQINYNLLSIPIYLLGQLRRLLSEAGQ